MREFKSFNPYIILLHFVFVVGACMLFVHPVILFGALLSGGIYALILCKNALKKILMLLPTALVIAVLNPLFNHRGITTLFYLPSGNPVTLEAIVYGLMSGIMLEAVVLWFMCFGELFKSDKILYVFGKVAPFLSIISYAAFFTLIYISSRSLMEHRSVYLQNSFIVIPPIFVTLQAATSLSPCSPIM